MKPFFKHYPQLKKYPFPERKTFSWYWYYAMQQMGDDQAAASRLAIERKLASRQRFTDIFAFFFPSIQTQLGVNKIAGSDLNTHLAFQQAVRKYHEQIRLHFYPAIFLNQSVNDTDIKDFKLKKYNRKEVPHIWVNILSVSLLTVVIMGATAFNLKRFNS